MANLTKLSKFLAVVLRHEPDRFGLVLDEEGFTPLDAVWTLIQHEFDTTYRYEDLLAVVTGDAFGKKRYEIRDNNLRAMFGHSDIRPITYPMAIPPEVLFHGTTQTALAHIRDGGLQALSRQYVHLTPRRERAETVAQRHVGHTLVLMVRALDAHHNGVVFYHPEPEHYLATAIPSPFIVFETP